MGAVFLARHEETGAVRALKLLPAGADGELEARFLREAEAMGRVDGHPNVVRVFGAGREAGHLFLVMEAVEGEDLERRLARDGPLAPAAAVELALALCRALAHVHARGILHRDLKPANVLLEPDGRPRVTDFGLARLTGAEALTRTGDYLGSPAWMAPEQADGSGVDERTDVYGLGAVLYAALCGRPPFGAEVRGVAAVLAQVLTQPPPPPSRVNPTVPRALEALVLRCLAKDPAARYPSARALAADLQRWQEGGLGAPARRRAAVAAALLAAVGLSLALVLRGQGTPPESAAALVSSSAGAARLDTAAPLRARYLELCARPFALAPLRLQEELERAAQELASDLEPLRLEKRAALEELARDPQWIREVASRLAGAGPRAELALDGLSAVLRSAPGVAPPAQLEELLDRALLDVLREADWRDSAAVQRVTDFELRRAPVLGWARRPPAELTRWIKEAVLARGQEYPLDLLRVALWADFPGLSARLSPLSASRRLDQRELERALEREPDSQALALLLALRFADVSDRQQEGVAGYEPIVEALARTSAPPPSDLGLYWRSRAAALETKLRFRRYTRHRPSDPSLVEDWARGVVQAARRALGLARGLVGGERMDGVAGAPEPEWIEVRETTHFCAVALLDLHQAREGAAQWGPTLDLLRARLSRPGVLDHALPALRLAAEAHAAAGDPRAAELAEEALRLSRTPAEERDALVSLLSEHLTVSGLHARLSELDQRFDDHERLRVWLGAPGESGPALAQLAFDSARALGRRDEARARLALALELLPAHREALLAKVPPEWR